MHPSPSNPYAGQQAADDVTRLPAAGQRDGCSSQRQQRRQAQAASWQQQGQAAAPAAPGCQRRVRYAQRLVIWRVRGGGRQRLQQAAQQEGCQGRRSGRDAAVTHAQQAKEEVRQGYRLVSCRTYTRLVCFASVRVFCKQAAAASRYLINSKQVH